MVNKRIERLVYPIGLITSIIALLSCLFQVSNVEKAFLVVLPISYILISALFKNNFTNITNNIAKLLIEALFFIRLVLLPLVYSFVSEKQLFEGRASIGDHFNDACFLMAYEFFFVQLAIYIYDHKRRKKRIRFIGVSSRIDISNALIVFLVTFIILVSVFAPQYAGDFKTIVGINQADFTSATQLDANFSGIGRMVITLFSLCFQIFRIIFPAYLIKRIFDKNRESSLSGVVLFFSCVLQFFFLTSTFAEAIVACLAIILFYISLFPNKARKTFLLLGLSTLGMILIYFIIRYYVNTVAGLYYKNSGPILYSAQIMNAYFTGVDNVAAIFNIEPGHAPEAFKAGIIGAIPFNSTLFGARGNKLQYFYNLANRSYGQIPPTIGAGRYYFGAILSPVITVIFTYLSMSYYDKANKIKGSIKYISSIFCCIVFSLGTVMYSPSITLQWYVSWGIPMLIITYFTNDKDYLMENSI